MKANSKYYNYFSGSAYSKESNKKLNLNPYMKVKNKSSNNLSSSGYAKVSFDGFINENYFQIKLPEKDLIQNLEISHATTFNPITQKKDTFIGLLLKSKYDGIGNRRPIDLSIALDISGSMSSIDEENSKSRIYLAKESLKKLISLMDDKNDKISLITFNNKAKKIFGLLNKKEIQNKYLKDIDDIKASGGTNLIEALNEAMNNLNHKIKKEKRIVILTDAVYNDSKNKLLNLVKNCVENKNISITIIAISSESNLSLADKLCHFKGCNYFPICKSSELENYLVKNFKYIFFPNDYDTKLIIKSENSQILKCLGGGNEILDEYENKFNDYAPGISNEIFFNFNSSFPSDMIKIKDDFGIEKFYIKGGLILLKINNNNFDNNEKLKFEFNLQYKSYDNKNYNQNYSYIIDNVHDSDFFKDNNIKKGISIYYFTSLLNYLVEIKNKKNIISKNDINLLNTKNNLIEYLINNFTFEPDYKETNDNFNNYLKLIEGGYNEFKTPSFNNNNLSAPAAVY